MIVSRFRSNSATTESVGDSVNMSPTIDTRTVVLQALAQGESYGLDLMARVQKNTNGQMAFCRAHLPAVEGARRRGAARADSTARRPRNTRARRRLDHRLTDKGLRAAQDDAQAVAGLFAPTLGTAWNQLDEIDSVNVAVPCNPAD